MDELPLQRADDNLLVTAGEVIFLLGERLLQDLAMRSNTRRV